MTNAVIQLRQFFIGGEEMESSKIERPKNTKRKEEDYTIYSSSFQRVMMKNGWKGRIEKMDQEK